MDARVGQLKAFLWAWIVAKLVSPGPPRATHLGLGDWVESAPLHACPQGPFTLACGEGLGPSLQRAEASSLAVVSSEGCGELSMAL